MARAPVRRSKVPAHRAPLDALPVQLALYGLRVTTPVLLVFAGWLVLCSLIYGWAYRWYDPATLQMVAGPGPRDLLRLYILPAALLGSGGTLLTFAPVTVSALRRSRDGALEAWYRIFPIDGRVPGRVERVRVPLARDRSFGLRGASNELRMRVAIPLEDAALVREVEAFGITAEVLVALRQVVFFERDLEVRRRDPRRAGA